MSGEVKLEEISIIQSSPSEYHIPNDETKKSKYKEIEYKSVTEKLLATCKKYGNRVCYTWREVIREHITSDISTGKNLVTYELDQMGKSISYSTFMEVLLNLSYSLKLLFSNCNTTIVGLSLETCKEWVLFAHACLLNKWTVATSYANLGVDGLIKIINETQLEVLCIHGSQLGLADKVLKEKCPSLKHIVVVGSHGGVKSIGFHLYSFYDLVCDGAIERKKKEMEYSFEGVSLDDLAFLMYTSGTTGDPKGVQLSHRNILVSTTSVMEKVGFKETDVHLSYLPLGKNNSFCLSFTYYLPFF